MVGPGRRGDAHLAPRGAQPHLHRGAPVVRHEHHMPVLRPPREPRHALDQPMGAQAQVVGDVAVPGRDRDAHGQPP